MKRDFLTPEMNLDEQPASTAATTEHPGATMNSSETEKRGMLGAPPRMFNDELWDSQWYIWDKNRKYSKYTSMGIIEAWNMGYTGRGVVVSVLDDGKQQA